ncbi:MAG: taurine ABC transporter permease [Candidatus Rokubacteria bacterium 13_2_20CM_69_15_1]|nr:MAG: taurine ABC transporter permease [Candidatus Rokubacteria bacterium 13_2_20CM_69_15_1]
MLALRVEWLLTAATLTSLLLAWYVVARFGLVSDLFVPHPAAVWAAFTDILLDGYRGATLLRHLGDSLYRVVVGFLLAVVTAVPLGLAIGYSSKVQAVFDPIIEFYRPLPPLAYYTLLVIWLGIENESKIALLYFAAFPPLSVSAMAGVRGVASERIQGAQSLGASRWQVFRYVIFPSCLPDIFTGMRVSIGFTYTTLVAAEMVAATSGIGWMVLDASKFLRSDVIFMGNIVMGLTGIGLDRLIRTAEGRVVPWKGRA